jgi:hypothetical protein
MKGNILRMLNESEKKRIVGMHTSHKNQKLDDEAERLSKLFGYRINESAIRGYLITEAIGGEANDLTEDADMTIQIDAFLKFDSMSGVYKGIVNGLNGAGALFNIPVEKAARLLFYGIVKSNIAQYIKGVPILKVAPKVVSNFLAKQAGKLSVEEIGDLTTNQRINEIANNISATAGANFTSKLSGAWDIAQLNKGENGGVLTVGVITSTGRPEGAEPGQESNLEDIVRYFNTFNISYCSAIWGDKGANQQYYNTLSSAIEDDGSLDITRLYEPDISNGMIDLFGTKDKSSQTAKTTGGMTKGYTIVKTGAGLPAIVIDEAYKPGEVGPTSGTLTEAVDGLNKIFADKSLELTGIEIQGTADVAAFKPATSEAFAALYNVSASDVPPTNLIPAAPKQGTIITTENRLSSGNAWLAYQRGKLYAEALKGKVTNMPEPTITGIITASGKREVNIILNVKKRDENIIVPPEYIMKTVGKATSTTDLAGQLKIMQCWTSFTE